MKSLLILVSLGVAGLSTLAAFAADYGCGCQQAGCGHRCPACPKCSHKICTATVEKTKEEHECFEVECKEICVPKITLPCWTDAIPFLKCKDKSCGCDKCPTKECCDVPRCGYVKVVKVLKKHEYECDSCGYKWTIEAPCCNTCQGGACQGGACTNVPAPTPWQTVPDDAAPAAPPAPPQASYYAPFELVPRATGNVPAQRVNQRANGNYPR